MTTETTAQVIELPAMPPPSFVPVYIVMSFYVGPGYTSESWKLHPRTFMTLAEAKQFAGRLAIWHRHIRICKIL